MNVAKARYSGRQRVYNRRGPSGKTITLRRGEWAEIDDLADARRLDGTRNVDVEWTARGRLYAYGAEVLDWGYQKKRSLASELELEFDGQPDEETLEESLENQLDDLQERGEI